LETTELKALFKELRKKTKTYHYTCEDPWYSCPQSSDGNIKDDGDDECDCGADERSETVKNIIDKIESILNAK